MKEWLYIFRHEKDTRVFLIYLHPLNASWLLVLNCVTVHLQIWSSLTVFSMAKIHTQNKTKQKTTPTQHIRRAWWWNQEKYTIRWVNDTTAVLINMQEEVVSSLEIEDHWPSLKTVTVEQAPPLCRQALITDWGNDISESKCSHTYCFISCQAEFTRCICMTSYTFSRLHWHPTCCRHEEVTQRSLFQRIYRPCFSLLMKQKLETLYRLTNPLQVSCCPPALGFNQ